MPKHTIRTHRMGMKHNKTSKVLKASFQGKATKHSKRQGRKRGGRAR